MIRFGAFLLQWRLSFDALAERVRVAEEVGFDYVWLMDHLWAPGAPQESSLEAWTTATALAMRTDRIRLGHMVLCSEFRHPAVLAKMATTLDVISGGRLDLGLGWGSVPEELEAFGVSHEPPAVRAARLGETLEILELLWSGERVSYVGHHFQLDGAIQQPRPTQGRIPIHIGGAGRRLTMPLVAKHADWWNCVSYAADDLAELRPLAGEVRFSVQHPVALVMNPAESVEILAKAERRFGAWGGLVAGSPERVAEALIAEVELGAEAFVIQLSDFGRPETLRAFAREVIPRVRQSSKATPQ
ncbi:MAG: LLM class flavin-dependent oxidoreductase [Deltaproteobacteria bacterium]|nr:LLM class flavin-dependent oxidoreductase [Deltaproteobacteria bacterium]